MELGTGIVSGEHILEPDLLKFDFRYLYLFVSGGDLVAGQGTAI